MSIFKRIFRRPIYALLLVLLTGIGAGGYGIYKSGWGQGKAIPGSGRPKVDALVYEAPGHDMMSGAATEAPQPIKAAPLPKLSIEEKREVVKSALQEAQSGHLGLIATYLEACFGGGYELRGVTCSSDRFDKDAIAKPGVSEHADNMMSIVNKGTLRSRYYNAVIATYPSYPYQYACQTGGETLADIVEAMRYWKRAHPELFKKEIVLPGTATPERLKAEKSSLHAAAFYGHLDAMKKFYKDGADLNAEDPFHMTPIKYAILNGQQDAAFFLLDKGVTVPKSGYDWDPVAEAAMHGNGLLLDYLQSRGFQPGSLQQALEADNMAVIKVLVERFGVKPSRYDLSTPKDIAIVHYLMGKGAGYDRYGQPTRLPFKQAMYNERSDLIEEFQHYAPLPMFSPFEKRALELALQLKNYHAAQTLLDCDYGMSVGDKTARQKLLKLVRQDDFYGLVEMCAYNNVYEDRFREAGLASDNGPAGFIEFMRSNPKMFTPIVRLRLLGLLDWVKQAPGEKNSKAVLANAVVSMKPDLRDTGLDWEQIIEEPYEFRREQILHPRTARPPQITPEERKARLDRIDENIRIIAEAFRPKEK